MFGKKLIYAQNRRALKIAERFADASVRKSIEVNVRLLDSLDDLLGDVELYLERTVKVDDADTFYRCRPRTCRHGWLSCTERGPARRQCSPPGTDRPTNTSRRGTRRRPPGHRGKGQRLREKQPAPRALPCAGRWRRRCRECTGTLSWRANRLRNKMRA